MNDRKKKIAIMSQDYLMPRIFIIIYDDNDDVSVNKGLFVR